MSIHVLFSRSNSETTTTSSELSLSNLSETGSFESFEASIPNNADEGSDFDFEEDPDEIDTINLSGNSIQSQHIAFTDSEDEIEDIPDASDVINVSADSSTTSLLDLSNLSPSSSLESLPVPQEDDFNSFEEDPDEISTVDLCETSSPQPASSNFETDSESELEEIETSPPAPTFSRSSRVIRINRYIPYRRPSPAATSSSSSSSHNGITCPICLDNAKDRAPVSTSCGHVYCHNCLSTLISKEFRPKCPMCNKELPIANPYIRLYL